MGLRRCVRKPSGRGLSILQWAEFRARNAIGQHGHPSVGKVGGVRAGLRSSQAKTWFLL